VETKKVCNNNGSIILIVFMLRLSCRDADQGQGWRDAALFFSFLPSCLILILYTDSCLILWQELLYFSYNYISGKVHF